MKAEYIPLEKIPKIDIVDAPTDKIDESLLAAARKKIAASEDLFNGPVLHAKEVSRENLVLFPVTYDWTLSNGLPTLGSITVSLLLENNGRYLWQKRSGKVILPHFWDFAAGGTATTQNLEEEVRKEAFEELGQEEIHELGIQGMTLFPNSKIDLLFHGYWSGQEIVTNDEVVLTSWSMHVPKPTIDETNLIFRSWQDAKKLGG